MQLQQLSVMWRNRGARLAGGFLLLTVQVSLCISSSTASVCHHHLQGLVFLLLSASSHRTTGGGVASKDTISLLTSVM